MDFVDRAEKNIKAARQQAELAWGDFPHHRTNVWKELVAAETNLGRAIDRLNVTRYSELFYPKVQYNRMFNYSQPDGIARHPGEEKPKKRKRKPKPRIDSPVESQREIE